MIIGIKAFEVNTIFSIESMLVSGQGQKSNNFQ